MHVLLKDEDVPKLAADELRKFGHDVITLNDLALNGIGLPDREVLAIATALGRAVITHNKRDYIKLHKATEGSHAGLIVCSRFDDPIALAQKIHSQIEILDTTDGKLIRVNRGD